MTALEWLILAILGLGGVGLVALLLFAAFYEHEAPSPREHTALAIERDTAVYQRYRLAQRVAALERERDALARALAEAHRDAEQCRNRLGAARVLCLALMAWAEVRAPARSGWYLTRGE